MNDFLKGLLIGVIISLLIGIFIQKNVTSKYDEQINKLKIEKQNLDKSYEELLNKDEKTKLIIDTLYIEVEKKTETRKKLQNEKDSIRDRTISYDESKLDSTIRAHKSPFRDKKRDSVNSRNGFNSN